VKVRDVGVDKMGVGADRIVIEFSVVRWACEVLDGCDVGKGGGARSVSVCLHVREL
jgi:hypothetical protein